MGQKLSAMSHERFPLAVYPQLVSPVPKLHALLHRQASLPVVASLPRPLGHLPRQWERAAGLATRWRSEQRAQRA